MFLDFGFPFDPLTDIQNSLGMSRYISKAFFGTRDEFDGYSQKAMAKPFVHGSISRLVEHVKTAEQATIEAETKPLASTANQKKFIQTVKEMGLKSGQVEKV